MRTIDQNQFSKKQLIAVASDGILIPDVTWFENVKNPTWRKDVEKTFEAFHRAPDKLHIAFSIGELLRRELSSRTPTTDPVDWEGTERLRELLRQDDYISTIEANVDSLRSIGLDPIVQLADNRSSLVDGMRALNGLVGNEMMAKYRASHRTTNAPLSAFAPSIAALTERTLSKSLSDLGLSPTDCARLNVRQSVFFRSQFSFWAQVFRYAMDSPTLQRGDDKLLNDLVDSDFAIVASYTDALETDEKLLRERYDALKSAITL